MDAKTILFVTRELVPFYFGGIGTQFKAMAKLFTRTGHTVCFLTQKPENFDPEVFRENYGSVDLFFTNESICPTGVDPHAAYAVQVSREFDRIYGELTPDIVFLAEFEAEGFVLLFNAHLDKYRDTRFILTINGMHRDAIKVFEGGLKKEKQTGLDDPDERLRCRLEDACVLLAPEITAPTEIAWRELKDRMGIDKNARIIPNLIDRELFDPEGASVRENGDRPLILFVGRLDRHKGSDLLLKAYLRILKELKNESPEIVFIGRDRPWIEYGMSFLDYWQGKIPRDFEEKITFLGQIDHDQVVEYLRKATVCVFPSRWEVFGIVCLEAMALGCPVLVSKGTGLEEVLGSDLFEYTVDISKDEGPLTEKLLEILRESSHYRNNSRKFRKRALEIVKNGENEILEMIETPSFPVYENFPEAAWKQYTETLMMLFSQLWDSTEFAYERLYKNRFQVYFFKNGETSESRSAHCYYPMSKWSEVLVDLPSGITEGVLRMDPSDRPGTVFIKRITIEEANGGEVVFTADGSNRFAGCSVQLNDEYEYDNKALVIHARTEDPQILLHTPPVFGPVVVKANICFRNEVLPVRKSH